MDLSKKAVTCIDIGTESIKLLTGFMNSEGKIQIQKAVWKVFNSGAGSKNGSGRPIEALTGLLSHEKICDNVYLCLSNPKNSLYQMLLPEMPRQKLDDAIKSELIQKKIFDLLKHYYGYVTSRIDYEKDTVQYKTFVACQPREDVENYLKLLESHHLRVQCFEHPNMVLINGMQRMGYFSDNKACLILSMGASTCSFMVVHNNSFVFERKLSSTGEAFTKNISDACKLNWEASEKLKKENGIALDQLSDQFVEAHHILISSVEKLITDIEYSMKYFFFQVAKSKVTTFETVFLTGGSSCMPGFKDFMEERLKMKCFLLDFKDNMVFPKELSILDNKTSGSIFSTALGLFYWEGKTTKSTRLSLFSNISRGNISFTQGVKYGSGVFIFIFLIFYAWRYWVQ